MKGTNSDQCGQKAETACKTVAPILKQIRTLTFVSPDLLEQVEEVWRQLRQKLHSPPDLRPFDLSSNRSLLPTSPPLQTTTHYPVNFSVTLFVPTTLSRTASHASFDFPAVSPLFIDLCTQDQQLNYNFIDDACIKIKDICLSYFVLDEDREYFNHNMNMYCLHTINRYIEILGLHCNSTVRHHTEYVAFAFREHFIKEVQEQMMHQLKSIVVQILTDAAIEFINETLLGGDIHYNYQLHIIPTEIQFIPIDILNSNIHKVHLHLDNSQMSIHIKDNVFTEAGIIISSILSDFHQPVMLENNTFEGDYSQTVLEVQNTSNVFISSCVFNNSHVLAATQDIKTISAILCYNSQIEMHNIFFSNISFYRIGTFENCIIAVNHLKMSMSGKYLRRFRNFLLPYRSDRISLLYFQHSEVTVENSIFEHNMRFDCFFDHRWEYHNQELGCNEE